MHSYFLTKCHAAEWWSKCPGFVGFPTLMPSSIDLCCILLDFTIILKKISMRESNFAKARKCATIREERMPREMISLRHFLAKLITLTRTKRQIGRKTKQMNNISRRHIFFEYFKLIIHSKKVGRNYKLKKSKKIDIFDIRKYTRRIRNEYIERFKSL